MENKDIFFSGTLKGEYDNTPVEIHYGSKFSVLIKAQKEFAAGGENIFSSMSVDTGTGSYELGRCRLIPDDGPGGFIGRLVFVDDIYNFDVLFREKDLVNLERLSKDLNMVLHHKEKVRDDFKNYISRLTYDLRVYKQFFDELDDRINSEPESVREPVFRTLRETEGRKFMVFFEGYLLELENLISGYSREEHEIHGFYLRKQLWDIILCSEFLTRTNVKPRGYVGDSEMMRMIYENEYRGAGTFAKVLYKISIEHPGAQAVRNRRVMIPAILKDVKEEFSKNSESMFRFMSVACGPAYELHDIFTGREDADFFHCTLLDQDSEAIGEAADNIRQIEEKTGCKINVTYHKDSVRTMVRTKNIADKWGRFNYIYTMGLFDYLTPPVAKAVIEKLYSLLEPGGKIFVGNYHFNNRSRWFMEYWHDWVLYYRSEDEFISLLRDTDASDIKIIFEDTGSQMFLSATKP